MKTNRPGLPALLARGAAYALVLTAVLWTIAYLFLPERLRGTISFLEGRILLFGGLSSVAIAAALTFWVAKRVRRRFKKRGFEDFGLARRWVRFLREHHQLLGWGHSPRLSPIVSISLPYLLAALQRRSPDG